MAQYVRNYEVIRELGVGHFGKVYLAVGEVPARGLHPARRRVVAIKKLKDQGDPESLRLLLQEFALLDQVKHRGIVRVFEYLDEEHAVVLEYVHGVTLRTILDDCREAKEQVFTEAAIEIGCEIADALYQAWTTPGDNGERLQLVHRDLKPENIMLTPGGEVKVLDFGLARVDNADFAKDELDLVRGTPVYMAPEQARGEEIDHRTDLFALGLILYELLSGRAAYRVSKDGPDPIGRVYQQIEHGEVSEAVRELEQKLPGAGPILARLLQVRPRNRYSTGQDLLVDLRRQLYKDRGAYLKEFCGFYFGSLHRLPDPPDPDAPQGGRMSSDKRTSIEERLARAADSADAGEAAAPKGAVPVRRAPRIAPAADKPAAAPPPEPAKPAAPVARAAPRITQRAAAATEPDLDDIVPPSVKAPKNVSGGPPPRKLIGARSPDETGMLQMVPLANSEDEAEASADPSATSFFAIPAPKAERPKAVAAPVPGGSPTPLAASSSGSAPPPPYSPPAAGSAPAAAVVAGPVIYANNPAGTPFQTAGAAGPTQGSADESRMQSARVYVLVLLVLVIFCFGVIGAGGVVWWYTSTQNKPTETVAKTEAPPPPPPAEPDPVPVEPQVKAAPTVKKTSTTAKTTTTPSEPAPSKGGKGAVTVKVSGGNPTAMFITCSDGYQERTSFSGGSATLQGVPNDGDCKLSLGGVAATKWSVHGSRSYTCMLTGTTLQCS